MNDTPTSYAGYLRLADLLELQNPRADPPAHDELQFIVVHQVYELWFRLLIHEVRATIDHLRAGEIQAAHALYRRMIEIGRVMAQQVSVMETMAPARFLEFRDLLQPASGFQSIQFRELEFLSGLRDERYLSVAGSDPDGQARLRAAMDGPSLWSATAEALASRGMEAAGEAAQRAVVERVYASSDPLDVHQLFEAMVSYDEEFRVWRARHALMAERMIGAKPGTGAVHTGELVGRDSFQEPGVHYLKGRVDARFFPILWEARTELGT